MTKNGWYIESLKDSHTKQFRSYQVFYINGKIKRKVLSENKNKINKVEEVTTSKLQNFLKDEQQAHSEYKQLGLNEMAQDEYDHAKIINNEIKRRVNI